MNMRVYLKMYLEKLKWAEEKYMNALAWFLIYFKGTSQDHNAGLNQWNAGMPWQGKTKI